MPSFGTGAQTPRITVGGGNAVNRWETGIAVAHTL